MSEHPTSIYKKINKDLNVFNLEKLTNSELDEELNKTNTFIAMINNKNERKTKSGKKFCFFSLSDDTNNIDAICFSEVLDNINFQLNNSDIYLFRISKQLMKDTARFVINDIKKIENSGRNMNYGIQLRPEKLDYIKFKSLLNNHLNGSNKIIFKFILDDKEIEVESYENYKIDLDFMDKIKSVKGIIDFKKIN